jgi:predicted RNase H-like nuclease
VLCAYIARFASSRPADVTIYGDVETGCIVTPTLPETPGPSKPLRPETP